MTVAVFATEVMAFRDAKRDMIAALASECAGCAAGGGFGHGGCGGRSGRSGDRGDDYYRDHSAGLENDFDNQDLENTAAIIQRLQVATVTP